MLPWRLPTLPVRCLDVILDPQAGTLGFVFLNRGVTLLGLVVGESPYFVLFRRMIRGGACMGEVDALLLLDIGLVRLSCIIPQNTAHSSTPDPSEHIAFARRMQVMKSTRKQWATEAGSAQVRACKHAFTRTHSGVVLTENRCRCSLASTTVNRSDTG